MNTYNTLEEINKRLGKAKISNNQLENRNFSNNIKGNKNIEELEQFDKVKTRVLKYVLYKKRTAEEVRKKFESIYESETLNDVINNLIELGYINDSSYIDKAINEYISLKNMSLKEIRYKLLSKGLNNKIIDEYFEKKRDLLNEYEINSAKNIVLKKSKTMDENEIKGFLMRKGYTIDNIRKALM